MFWGKMEMLRAVTLLLSAAIVHVIARRGNGLKYSILEESVANTEIGNIAEDARMTRQGLSYKFQSKVEACPNCFMIEETTGKLKTASVIDRESLCQYERHCTVSVEIGCQTDQFFQSVKVNIEILDINDNAPRFPEPSAAIAISESAAPGIKMSIPMAMDKDSPRYGVKTYKLISNTDKFSIHESNVGDDIANIQVSLNGKLDREVTDMYYLHVQAIDGGDPPKSGMLRVNVTILDVNDNGPKFNQTEYRLEVPEDAKVGTTIGRVYASDLDIDESGRVTYDFNQKTRNSFGNIFGITRHGGEVYLRANLNYETRKDFRLLVTAHDQGSTPLVALTKVLVTVTDVNDHAPVIKVNTFAGPNEAKISEGAGPGQIVAFVTVSDPDQGINGQFKCHLESTNFKFRSIYKNEYEITTLRQFDRETQAVYNISLKCRDQGSPGMSSSQSISIVITDENDNDPQFMGTPYNAELQENNYSGAQIIQVSASDLDAGDNGLIKYKISGKFADTVSINSHTGLITAKEIFDYEKQNKWEFEVIAEDSGNKPRSATATVTLTILDANDEPPKFRSPGGYNFNTRENLSPGTDVGQVSAMDPDSTLFNNIIYSLKGPVKDLSAFKMEPYTGKIRTRKVLDREQTQTYSLIAVAKDSGTPPLSSTVKVKVFVQDDNDNSPVIDYPHPFNDTVTVSAHIPVGQELLRVRARDDDSGINAKLEYRILDQHDSHIFAIEPYTGAVSLQQKEPFDKQQMLYTIKIRVLDSAEIRKHSDAVLKVVLDKSIPYVAPLRELPVGPLGLTDHNMSVLIIVSGVSLFIIIILSIVLVCVKYKQYYYPVGDYGYYRPGTMDVKNMRLQDLVVTMDKLSPDEDDSRTGYCTRSWRYTTDTMKSNSLRRSRDNFAVVERQKCDEAAPFNTADTADV